MKIIRLYEWFKASSVCTVHCKVAWWTPVLCPCVWRHPWTTSLWWTCQEKGNKCYYTNPGYTVLGSRVCCWLCSPYATPDMFRCILQPYARLDTKSPYPIPESLFFRNFIFIPLIHYSNYIEYKYIDQSSLISIP